MLHHHVQENLVLTPLLTVKLIVYRQVVVINIVVINRMGREVEDQLLMVYDMRMMKLSIPLRCALPPYLLRFVPGSVDTKTTTCATCY